MGILGKKETKGMRCKPNQDGSVTCERIFKDQKGEILGDGQAVTIVADPTDNCKPRLVGDATVFDNEMGKFDEIAGRVSQGCKRNQQPTEK